MQNLTSLTQTSAGNITAAKNFTVTGNLAITGTTAFTGSIATGSQTIGSLDVDPTVQLYIKGTLKLHDHADTGDYAFQLRTESNHATTNFFGMDCEVHQMTNRTGGVIRGLSMTGRVTAEKTISGTANMIPGYFNLDVDGTLNGTGLHAALYAVVSDGGTFTAVSHLATLWVDSHQSGTVTGSHELVYLTNNGTTTMDCVFYIDLSAAAKFTNLINFSADQAPILTNALVPAAEPTALTMGADKALRVDIGGTPYYIPLYDTLHA